MLELILASSNEHKAIELSALFSGVAVIKAAPSALEVEEDGGTFVQNAFKKAHAYFEKYKTPTMADDSGLVLEFFPEILGVQSARYEPNLPNYKDKCAKLLESFEQVKPDYKRAHFICVLCFYLNPKEVYFFEGRVHGVIGESYRGDHGFGYDPIFVPDRDENDKKTMAELPEWKMIHSHRAKAVKSAAQFLKSNILLHRKD